MVNQIDIEEGASRQHLSFAMICAIYCWHNECEATWLPFDEFEQLIGLSYTKIRRFKWVKRDVSAYFKYIYTCDDKTGKRKLLFLSRVPQIKIESNKELAIRFAPKLMDIKGHGCALDSEEEKLDNYVSTCFPFVNSVNNKSEMAIQMSLTLLSQGMVTPEDVF